MPLLDERRFPLKDGSSLNIDRCARTLKEWHKKGVLIKRNGRKVRIRLEVLREGNRLVTSREAVKRFLDATNPELSKLNGHKE
ncbi:MAG TPA: hypothetical protein VFB80_11660 [Pirellulaceae bacterium]|nr:hypothetical protein [Pirellulaceae bacterium]